ncbi:UNVERIFIED_CONTAM: hypothetical protein FKN15_017332 [Acipenser sinensis]
MDMIIIHTTEQTCSTQFSTTVSLCLREALDNGRQAGRQGVFRSGWRYSFSLSLCRLQNCD